MPAIEVLCDIVRDALDDGEDASSCMVSTNHPARGPAQYGSESYPTVDFTERARQFFIDVPPRRPEKRKEVILRSVSRSVP